MSDTTTTIPESAGLPLGGPIGEPDKARRAGEKLIDAAADGLPLTDDEQGDLLSYFLTNDGLPGDEQSHDLEFTIGEGKGKRTNVWQVRTITWDEWQDGRSRAVNEAEQTIDAFVWASYNVARALVRPALGPAQAELQKRDGVKGPADAADVLRRMFAKQSGVLMDMSGEVLRLSKLLSAESSVRVLDKDVAAGKR